MLGAAVLGGRLLGVGAAVLLGVGAAVLLGVGAAVRATLPRVIRKWGMFTFTTPYSQLTREGVRTLRADKRGEAAQAMRGLATMGEKAPELAKEAGA